MKLMREIPGDFESRKNLGANKDTKAYIADLVSRCRSFVSEYESLQEVNDVILNGSIDFQDSKSSGSDFGEEFSPIRNPITDAEKFMQNDENRNSRLMKLMQAELQGQVGGGLEDDEGEFAKDHDLVKAADSYQMTDNMPIYQEAVNCDQAQEDPPQAQQSIYNALYLRRQNKFNLLKSCLEQRVAQNIKQRTS